jgi:glycosyltransferase involved in cell wall biosynthesis
MAALRSRVLYISYDGLMEPLGNSQVLQYLKKLAVGNTIFLMTYEKPVDWNNVHIRARLETEVREAGIHWVPLRYHKHPTSLATTYDVLAGLAVSLYLTVRYRITIVHARSYVSAIIALALKHICWTRFIFDMRGFWPDERTESGAWSKGSRLYRITKWFERRFLLEADAVVSLTQAAVSVMKTFDYLRQRQPPFYVITTCTNLELFRPRIVVNTKRGHFTLGYVGGVSLWYDFEAAIESFRCLFELRPDSRIVILNRGEHEYIRECLKQRGLSAANIQIRRAEYSQMPTELQNMDAALFFIKPTYSKLASAPTKLGELLACGVPCFTNSGVGDLDSILRDNSVGIVVEDTRHDSLLDGVIKLLSLAETPGIAARCRAAAVGNFSLAGGARAYDRIYRTLATGFHDGITDD